MSLIFLYLFIFIFGAFWGSFLNAVVYRIKEKKGFIVGRSVCPHCHHKLGFFDLIPILSFILLKGRCRYCQKKISFQYPLVETATGIIFLLIFNQFLFFSFKTFYLFLISSFLIVIFVYDLKHYLIPDKVIYPAIIVVFLYRLFESLSFSYWPLTISHLKNLRAPLLSGLLAGGFFLLIWFVSRGKWMGFGDVNLAFFMGLFLGFPSVLVALFSAFFIGAIIGLGLIAFGKKNLKSQIPFGPFLVTGTFLALFWGEQIIQWYAKLI